VEEGSRKDTWQKRKKGLSTGRRSLRKKTDAAFHRRQSEVGNLLSGGIQPVRTVQRALVLRQLGEGKSSPRIAANVGVVVNTVCEIRKRYEEGGLARALYDKARPEAEPLLKPKQRQQIIAMVCGPAPAGQARWTVRLIAAEAVKRALVPRLGRETIRVLLQSHDLQPWREKMWCVAELNQEYVERMKDVLALYEKPLSREEPVVCVDEKSVSLHKEVREPIPLQQGRVGRRDSEHKRCGTANVYCGVEPKAGVHFNQVTPTRGAHPFAEFLKSLTDFYPQAETIHLVMDNLNTHRPQGVGGSLWGGRGPRPMEAIYVALYAQTRQLAQSGGNRNWLAGTAMFGQETAGQYRSLKCRGAGLESRGQSTSHSYPMEVRSH
jgi:transposase